MRISYVVNIESNVLSSDKHEKLAPGCFFAARSSYVALFNVTLFKRLTVAVLLQFNRSASFFKLLLNVVCFVLGDTFFDR